MNLERDEILTGGEKYNSIFHELEQYIPNWRDIKKSFDEGKISIHDIRVTIGISYTVFDFFEEYKESIDQNTADFYDFFMIFGNITLNSHINLLEKEKDFTQSLLKVYKNINIYTSIFPKINIDFIKDKLGKKIQESQRKKEVHEYFEKTFLHELEQYLPKWREIKKCHDEGKVSMSDIRINIKILYTIFDFYEEYKEIIYEITPEFYDFFMIFGIITLNSHINLLEKEKDFTQSLLKVYKNINIYTSVFPKINIDFIKDKLGKKIQESQRKQEVHEYFEQTLLFYGNKYQDYLEQVEIIQQIDAAFGGHLKIQLFSESDLEYKKLEYLCKSLIKKAQNTGVSFYQELDELKEKISEYEQKYSKNDISCLNSILKELDIIKTIKEEVDDILSGKREDLTKITEESGIDAYNFYIAMKMKLLIEKGNL